MSKVHIRCGDTEIIIEQNERDFISYYSETIKGLCDKVSEVEQERIFVKERLCE